MALNNTREEKIYATVLSDGKIHVSVPEGTEGSVVREYETSDGKSGSKTEMIYTELVGTITKVDFFEGDFGKSLLLTVADGETKPVVLSLSTSSNFGEDMMKKLPAIDMDQPVIIAPYSFDDEKGKKKRGVTVTQDGTKLTNFFFDSEAKKNLHGYPEIPKAKGKKVISKDEWKIYFAQARVFLCDYIAEKFGIDTPEVSEIEQVYNDLPDFKK